MTRFPQLPGHPGRPLTRRRFVRAVGGFATAASLMGAAPQLISPASAHAKKEGLASPLPFGEIAPDVHVHHGVVAEMSAANEGAIANIGFVVGDDSVAMIDSGGSVEEGQAAVAAIRRVTDKPIAYLINTHMHPDHVFGNQVFKAQGATIVGHANLPAALAARRETYKASMADQMGSKLVDEVTITLPDETVADERTLDLGNRKIHLKAWQTAHTNNDLTIFDEKTGTLFAGDLLFIHHVPVIDGSILGWLRQTPELEALAAERVVAGHGPISSPWPAAIDPQTRYLEALADDLRSDIADGVPLAKAVETAAAGQASKWQLFGDYNERNATAAYAELEWE